MLVAVLLFVAVIYCYERTRPLLQQLVASKTAVPALPAPTKSDPLPTDLFLVALQESEPWAREQVLQSMRESYDTTQSWDAVRMRYGLNPAE